MLFDIKTGVIGVGSMGRHHARIYKDISNLIAVSDLDEKQGRSVASQHGVKWYSDYREMLDHVDAVTIAVPTSFHKEVSEFAAEAGVSILVEKPLAGNSKDAGAIIKTAEENEITLSVGHIERYNPVIQYAKEQLSSGAWGEIISLSARRLSSYPERINDVGVLFDLTIHDVDILRYLSESEVSSVYATGALPKDGVHEDNVNLFMNFENGKIGLCETSWLYPMKIRDLGIVTTTSHIEINYLSQEISLNSLVDGNQEDSNIHKSDSKINKRTISLEHKEPLQQELNDFLYSCTKNTNPLVSGIEGHKAIEIVEAGLKSLHEGNFVNIKKC